MSGHLVSIVYSPNPGSYCRRALSEAMLLAGHGIDGDRKAGHPKRNLNIMDQETLQNLDAEGIPTGPGVLGENLIIAGVGFDAQPAGALLRIGQQAVVEMVALRVPCYKLIPLNVSMPASVVGRVGVMARVVEGGPIRVGDAVAVL